MINPDHYFVNIFHHISLHLPVSANTPDTPIIHIAYLDPGRRRTGMHDLVIAYVDAHMSVITDQISRHFLGIADRLASARLRAGRMRHRNTETSEHRHGKSGAVRSVCQAGSAPYIRISHKLQRIRRDRRSRSASAGRRAASRRTAP